MTNSQTIPSEASYKIYAVLANLRHYGEQLENIIECRVTSPPAHELSLRIEFLAACLTMQHAINEIVSSDQSIQKEYERASTRRPIPTVNPAMFDGIPTLTPSSYVPDAHTTAVEIATEAQRIIELAHKARAGLNADKVISPFRLCIMIEQVLHDLVSLVLKDDILSTAISRPEYQPSLCLSPAPGWT